MGAYSHSADSQLGRAFKELPDPFHLLVKPATLCSGEYLQRLHRELDLPAGATLMPNPGDKPIDEQHRKVTGLAVGQRTGGGPPWKELLARVAAHHIGIEVG